MPKIECSISPSSRPERSMASLIAAPPNSGALNGDNAPPNLPNGVRAAPTIIDRSTSDPPVLGTTDASVTEGALVRYGTRKAVSAGESKRRRSRGEHRRLRDDLRELPVGDAREVQL